MKSFSQYYQDKAIDFALNRKRNGIFLDIGAHDGVSLSNTFFFERSRNWTGLCIEPIPEVFARLRSNRHCSVWNCCILDEEKEVTFRSVFPPLEMLSGILEFFDQRHIDRINAEVSIIADGPGYQDIMIPGHNINRLLETQGLYEIDYCSIDTEGAEVNIVKSIDFNRIRIRAFSIENNDTAGELRNYLSSFGYARYSLGSDDLYIKGKYSWTLAKYVQYLNSKIWIRVKIDALYRKYIRR